MLCVGVSVDALPEWCGQICIVVGVLTGLVWLRLQPAKYSVSYVCFIVLQAYLGIH